jgi:replicative DNA helicase
LADSGKRIRIDSLVDKKNISILSLDNNYKVRLIGVKKVFYSGKKTVFKLLLKSGREIVASANHPFLKLEGWTRLDNLIVGDRIAVNRIIPVPRKKIDISPDRLIVLGHLIGDGCYLKNQPLHYTNSEIDLIRIVNKSAEKEFNVKPRIVRQENWYHLYLSSREHLTHNKRNPIVKWLDEELGIYNQRSREKRIPHQIFSLSNQKIALFLKNLFSTDGSIHLYKSKKKKVTLYYASGSRDLNVDISNLLLRFGIISTITRSKKTGYKDIFNLQIQGKTDQIRFLRNIGFVGKKAKLAKDATKFLESINKNPNNDVIPKEIWEYIDSLRIKEGLTTRQLHRKLHWKYSGTSRYKNGISSERMKIINKLFKDNYLKQLINSDIYWDEVRQIEKIGMRDVYDIEVPKYHNFIANDIIVHNSIEQDSDVVMFLWREDEEKLEDMNLDIAKHRNGPLRSIKLHFKGDRIKFYGVDAKR